VREAAPQRDVDVLHQIAALVAVALVAAREAFDGRPVRGGGLRVECVLVAVPAVSHLGR
jgi:hypothetical protein